MTFAEYQIHSENINSQVNEHNKWVEKSRNHLLCVVGPAISKYNLNYLQLRFGNLILALVPWQITNPEKIESQIIDNIITKVLYESLIEDFDEHIKAIIKNNQYLG